MATTPAKRKVDEDENWEPPTTRAAQRRGAKGRPAATAAAAMGSLPGTGAGGSWMIRCSRENKILHWDFGSFEDCNSSKQDDAEEEILAMTRRGTGTWFHSVHRGQERRHSPGRQAAGGVWKPAGGQCAGGSGVGVNAAPAPGWHGPSAAHRAQVQAPVLQHRGRRVRAD